MLFKLKIKKISHLKNKILIILFFRYILKYNNQRLFVYWGLILKYL